MDSVYTVNKLWSLNLLFFCMLRMERKIVHVGTEKIIRYINKLYIESADFSITFIDAEDYATSEKWQKFFYVF